MKIIAKELARHYKTKKGEGFFTSLHQITSGTYHPLI
jgi:hypothetical protein